MLTAQTALIVKTQQKVTKLVELLRAGAKPVDALTACGYKITQQRDVFSRYRSIRLYLERHNMVVPEELRRNPTSTGFREMKAKQQDDEVHHTVPKKGVS